MPYLEKLKALKDKSHLTNTEIAQLSKIPLATITRVFNGATPNPTFETFVGIATALGVSLDEIAGLRSPEEAPLTPNIETTLTSYAELLKEKDERLTEKAEVIDSLKAEVKRERKEKLFLAIFSASIISVFLALIIIDLLNGNMGYFRY